ncbi:kinase-like domain-containing protein [Trichoderma sp. SZMC 28014]
MASRFYEYQSTVISERFHSPRTVGYGPHGQVFRAHDKKMDSFVVVKRLEMASIVQEETVKREILDIKKIRHRNIIPIYYALIRPGMVLLVTPVREYNLLSLTPMPYDMRDKTSNFYSLTIQMLSALTFLQEEGICHRNIKPTNILVQPMQRGYGFYLTDFALSYPQPPTADFLFSAPETRTDIYPVTCKQDVWSLYVTLAVVCGRITDEEIRCRNPLEIVQNLMDTSFVMPELEDMSRYNPTQRASASVMFHRLRPKEKLNYYGGVDYPDVSTEYFGLYGSGRLETEPMVFIGPNADLRGIDGPLGLSPTSVVQRPHASVPLAQPLPANCFDVAMRGQQLTPFPAELGQTSVSSPQSEYPQSPPEVPQQFHPEPWIKREESLEWFEYEIPEHQVAVERFEHGRAGLNLPPYRGIERDCTISRPYDGPADNNGPLPPLSSIVPIPRRADDPFNSQLYSQWSALLSPAAQRRLSSASSGAARRWDTFDVGPIHNGNPTIHFNGVGFMVQPQGLAYVRPYPMPCDRPTEASQSAEI